MPQQLGMEMDLGLLDADDMVLVHQKSAAHYDEFVDAGAVVGERQADAVDLEDNLVLMAKAAVPDAAAPPSPNLHKLLRHRRRAGSGGRFGDCLRRTAHCNHRNVIQTF